MTAELAVGAGALELVPGDPEELGRLAARLSVREPLYEESFVLIRAGSEEQAAARARELGSDEQTSYVNDAGETITWTLKHVLDISRTLTDELEDGSTLYSRHFRDYHSYRRFEPLLGEAQDGL